MWIFNAGDERAAKSIDESLRKLQTDYIDLLLIHQPFGDYYGTYRAMQKALAAGKVRAIGLSNFYDARFVDLAENMDVKPAVVQLEANVFTQQKRMRELMASYGTRLMAWAPSAEGQHGIFTNSTLTQIGAKYGKTAANRFLPISTIRLWRSSSWSTTPSSTRKRLSDTAKCSGPCNKLRRVGQQKMLGSYYH